MDKQKQIQFNLNNFLLATSFALDYSVSKNHYKRVAFISLKLALSYGLQPKEMSDLCSLSLVYDFKKEDLEKIPFLQKEKTLNNLLFKELITFASELDKKFVLDENNIEAKNEAINFAKKNLSSEVLHNFLNLSESISFWLDLESENDILQFIYSSLHDFTTALEFEKLLELTTVFHKIENSNSKLIQMCEKLLELYGFEHKDRLTFLISASMQNIGKLAIKKEVLEKKEKLTEMEYEYIKTYPYFTRKVLSSIMGFENITNLAIKVQERLDGKGYFLNIDAKGLSLKDRLLQSIVAYHALTEEKPYRKAYSHKEAIKILEDEVAKLKFDKSIIEDINKVFT